MPLHPQQDFQHTLREISVNRQDPCELVRELVSNSYDADAQNILLFPLFQYKGLVFFDDGIGLSESISERGVSPYVAFFSIGKGTKTKGQGIGYKCQGSKLCFASKRFSVITRCAGEVDWRYFTLENPRNVLSDKTDLTPERTSKPWDVLKDPILLDSDNRTAAILKQLDKEFFKVRFKTGTMIVLQEFDVEEFDKYFKTEIAESSYVYNYLRFFTAHGDVRRINSEQQGFSSRSVRAVTSGIRHQQPPALSIWKSNGGSGSGFVGVPAGWPYLDMGDDKPKNFDEFSRMRDATSSARFATTFKYQDQTFSLILAIDGKRKALDEYKPLSRQSSPRSGISFSDQRGVVLSSEGVRVCSFDRIFDQPALQEWSVLTEGKDHYVLVIDGKFDLVTNRNACAQDAITTLKQPEFLERIKHFFEVEIPKQRDAKIFESLLARLRRESTALDQDLYISRNKELKRGLAQRDHFSVAEIPQLKGKWLVSPIKGEEHFVGALYILFSHLVPKDSPLAAYWKRPLTFAGYGFDSLAVGDESKPLDLHKLLNIEYKYHFAADSQFNHPLSIVNRVVAWSVGDAEIGLTVQDTYHSEATVKEKIAHNGSKIGFVVHDVRERHGGQNNIEAEIMVLSLKSLLEATFKVQWRKPANA